MAGKPPLLNYKRCMPKLGKETSMAKLKDLELEQHHKIYKYKV